MPKIHTPARRFLFIFLLLLLIASIRYLFNDQCDCSIPDLPTPSVRTYDAKSLLTKRDSLLALAGKDKKIPSEFELVTLTALAHYPDLKEATIEFAYSDNGLAISARPDFTSILVPASRRRYWIVVNRNFKEFVLGRPFNAQVGVLGHELAHIQCYRHKNGIDLVYLGLKYLCSEPFKYTFERQTDRCVVQAGLGWQLYDFELYLSRKEILDQLEPSY